MVTEAVREQRRAEMSRIRTSASRVALDDIANVVCSYYGVTLEILRSRSRSRAVVEPRMFFFYLARERTHYSYEQIGEYLGRRDHSTVFSAWSTTSRRLEVDAEWREAGDDLLALMNMRERPADVIEAVARPYRMLDIEVSRFVCGVVALAALLQDNRVPADAWFTAAAVDDERIRYTVRWEEPVSAVAS